MGEKNPKTHSKNWMILCVCTGVFSLVVGILALFLQQWICAGILLLITVRQAIVYPKWKKKLN